MNFDSKKPGAHRLIDKDSESAKKMAKSMRNAFGDDEEDDEEKKKKEESGGHFSKLRQFFSNSNNSY